jgi:hypothetical protein
MSFTPLGGLFADDELRDPQTPAPQRARVANLNKQVDRLVQEKHNMQVRFCPSVCSIPSAMELIANGAAQGGRGPIDVREDYQPAEVAARGGGEGAPGCAGGGQEQG